MADSALVQDLRAAGLSVDTSESALSRATADASQLKSRPICVARPQSTAEIAAAVRTCRTHSVPLTVVGGYTGLSGGALGYNAVRLELRDMDAFSVGPDHVWAQAGASVPAIIRDTSERGVFFPFQPASACRTDDVYDYLGTTVGPVTIGGALGANASGLVGCKLGAALDWVRELTVVLPDGKTQIITDGFERYVGTEGRYGIVAEARIALPELPEETDTFLLSGHGLGAFAEVAATLGRSGVLPLLAEGMVLTGAPPDFAAIARRALDDPTGFIRQFGSVFEPHGWIVLLQGDENDTTTSIEALRSAGCQVDVRPLNDDQFEQFRQIRSAASDAIGVGVVNPHRTSSGKPPVERASAFLAHAIAEFQERGVRPKAEHNLGLLRVFLESDEDRDSFRAAVEEGSAFDDGSLALYEECEGNLATLLNRLLKPRVTPAMVEQQIAVNFPGNEDLLIQAEKVPETLELLENLMLQYGACPVPLFYCHINFRRTPGWILVHNRLLIDVTEFA
ncbi:MAG: FAD-binding oxidoreductase [Lentisphaerae bacterium]|jgi:FAD/FMN-containing dehydrogenase|nr:FAD-binding oxidoreductase [Lentisphaerota bacterium]MBT4815681.1 FAD-binding oxidoreductase [Lentisphaerota bacterium]MBT5612008.1 FAD-binding oxidoreductase [Lentisphaerota bacterium]MBT7057892.1 FAD-binding oxidoreductase [Lentisphaerota bacterium]MBT7846399.1 FAD-binding oxidoreductase [Lentisphaerota bacterium]